MRERLASVGAGRLAVSILALVLFAAWVLLLLAAVLGPCGDTLCMQDLAWVVPVAAVLLAGVVWLYGSRRTAAPLYVIAGYLGVGAVATVVVNPGYHLDPFVLATTLFVVVAIAAWSDLRRQARSAIITGVGLVVLGVWILTSAGRLTLDGLAPAVAGLLALGAWGLVGRREGPAAGAVP